MFSVWWRHSPRDWLLLVSGGSRRCQKWAVSRAAWER